MENLVKRVRITTEDNPYDPFTDWDQWYFFDISNGYNTCERLARLSKASTQLPDEANVDANELAIDQMLETKAISKQGKIVSYKKVYEK